MYTKRFKIFVLAVVFLICMIIVLALSRAIFNLYFLFNSYDYVMYDGQRYIVVDSLYFEDVITFDENGEYSEYKNGNDVFVKVEGWYPQKMILHNCEHDNYLFDYVQLCWLVNENFMHTDLLNENSIEKVIVHSNRYENDYELTQEEISLLLRQVEKLKITKNMITDEFALPMGDDWGTINIKAYNSPEQSYYSMFYFSVKGKDIFLMSNSNSFGFEFGQYIYIESFVD